LVRVRSSDATAPYANGGSNALISNRFPSTDVQAGRYTYTIRPTESVTPPPTPTPPTPGTSNCTPDAQTTVTWGLDRIDQRNLPLSTTYACAGDGTGVNAYIVDTGIYANDDFSARLRTGTSTVPDSGSTVDCNGHGTHVAGTVGGTKYGVAKNVNLYPVRVLDCSGSGYTSSVVSGLNWVADNAVRPAVVNMSLGGGTSKSLDDAVAALVTAGITVVVAAGNDNSDAANFSPAREPSAITVGSTTSTDARSSFSNYGSVVDIFAPGSSITSAWIGSATATNTISGTSMAAPHVAGAAAVYLGLNTGATPAQVVAALTNAATPNIVGSPGSGSPNLLLYARSFSAAPAIDSVAPVSGASTGGTSVTLAGTNFTGTTGVTVGGSAATSVSAVSDTQLTFTSPSGTAGIAAISVTNATGTTTLSSAFTFTGIACAVPILSSLSSSTGAADGTTTITITGQNFTGATSVTFGGTPATFSVVSGTSITATAPAKPVGDVNIAVTSTCGTSEGVTAFAYVGQPTLSSLSTDGGPLAGGQTVNIYGTNFTTGSTVNFGAAAAASVTYIGSTQLRVTTPSASQGTVNVSVTTAGGTATSTNAYSFYPAPTASSNSPTSGSGDGGDVVSIIGTGLDSVTAVTFGGTNATYYVFASTELIVFTPSRAAGTVNIVVTTLGGSATLTNAFTYSAATPALSSGGGSGGGSGGSDAPSSGGGAAASDEITKTEAAVTTNQVTAPGQFKILNAQGQPMQLRKAELTTGGFSIAGNDWEIAGSGALNSTNQTLTPGTRMTITGEGLQRLTTTGIYILSSPTWVGSAIVGYDNKFTANFMIPDLPAGNHSLQINMVRQGQLPVSIALGFTLDGTGAAAEKTPNRTTSAATQQSSSAQLIYFVKNSSKFTTSSVKKLKRLVTQTPNASVDITAFTASNVSARVAKKRAAAVTRYLDKWNVANTSKVEKGVSTTQSKSALLVINPNQESAGQNDQIDSFIIRYKKGQKPTNNSPLLGTDKVTSIKKTDLALGTYLGFGMYRIDLPKPITAQLADSVATELTKSRVVDFAEPNAQVSILSATNS
jgi:subtilisin family serine protease